MPDEPRTITPRTIAPRTTGVLQEGRSVGGRPIESDRVIGYRPIASREITGRPITDLPAPTVLAPPPTVVPGAGLIPLPSTNVQANDPTGMANIPVYGTGSPFAILSDLFLRSFGAGTGYSGPQETQRTIIEGTGGGNTGGILIVVGVIGFAIYWFFIRGK